MLKFEEITQLLEHRLAAGVYPGDKLPPLRKLADDMGVCYLTARKAVKQLEERKASCDMLYRLRVAVVAPMWAFSEWHRAIRDEVRGAGGVCRFHAYGSNIDPVITEAIAQKDYDLLFLCMPESPNARLLELIRKSKDRVVVMFEPLEHLGVRSLMGNDPESIRHFLDLLAERGHRRIDALGRDTDLQRSGVKRYEAWRKWLDEHGLDGRFHEVRHSPFEHDEDQALEACRKKFSAGEIGDAIFCFNPVLGLGLYRACYEFGIVPGRDISIFSFGHGEITRLMTPALATIVPRDVPGTVRQLLKEYYPGAERSEKLCFRPEQCVILPGESIQPE